MEKLSTFVYILSFPGNNGSAIFRGYHTTQITNRNPSINQVNVNQSDTNPSVIWFEEKMSSLGVSGKKHCLWEKTF